MNNEKNNRQSYRLRGNSFDRSNDNNELIPKKLIFLSVEGNVTEVQYFKLLNKKLDNAVFQIEVLSRAKDDGHSDPKDVIGLLNEFLDIGDEGVIPKRFLETLKEKNLLNETQINNLENGNCSEEIEKVIEEALLSYGIDYKYRKYLNNIKRENSYFGVVIDRDSGCRNSKTLMECYNYCMGKKIDIYLTNPCFEFWLLLHVCDVKEELPDKLERIRVNSKESKNHTFTSEMLTERAGCNKKISDDVFDNKFYPNIKNAVKNAEKFPSDFNDLLDEIGTNLPELIRKLNVDF